MAPSEAASPGTNGEALAKTLSTMSGARGTGPAPRNWYSYDKSDMHEKHRRLTPRAFEVLKLRARIRPRRWLILWSGRCPEELPQTHSGDACTLHLRRCAVQIARRALCARERVHHGEPCRHHAHVGGLPATGCQLLVSVTNEGALRTIGKVVEPLVQTREKKSPMRPWDHVRMPCGTCEQCEEVTGSGT